MLKQCIMSFALKQIRKKMSASVSEDFNVETYLNKIVEYFDPQKAPERKLVVVYEFHDSGKNDGAWTVTISNGTCVLTKGDTEDFDTRLYMTAEVYRRVMTGKIDFARLTYSVGAIRYFGNTLGHRELNSYLNIPKEARLAAL